MESEIMNPHPLLALLPTNPDEADSLISKMGVRGHSKQVLQWRNQEFLRMGFIEAMSSFLAHTNIDLHMMEKILKNGCDRTTAVDILLGTNFLGDDPTWNWQGVEDGEEDDETNVSES